MINIGPGELLAICAIALIVLGPDKLPQALRTVGRVTAELRRMSTGFQEDIRNAMDDALRDEEEDTQPEDRARSLSGGEEAELESLEDTRSTGVDTIGEREDVDDAAELDEAEDSADVAGGEGLKGPAKRNGSSGASGS